MNIKHVMVAHRGGARIFSYQPSSRSLHILERIEFPLGKLQDKDLDADRPGRTVASFRSGTSPLGDARDSVDHQQNLSVEFLVKHLIQERERYVNSGLVITAGPHLLGKLRAEAGKHLGDAVVYVPKDLAKVPDAEIFPHVRSFLAGEDEDASAPSGT